MAMFATSVLLQHKNADGTFTTSHTLHWTDAKDHDEAIDVSAAEARSLKPHLELLDAICGNQLTGVSKRVAFDDSPEGAVY